MKDGYVAPLAGAWIETDIWLTVTAITYPSHPSRVRGLKHYMTLSHISLI